MAILCRNRHTPDGARLRPVFPARMCRNERPQGACSRQGRMQWSFTLGFFSCNVRTERADQTSVPSAIPDRNCVTPALASAAICGDHALRTETGPGDHRDRPSYPADLPWRYCAGTGTLLTGRPVPVWSGRGSGRKLSICPPAPGRGECSGVSPWGFSLAT